VVAPHTALCLLPVLSLLCMSCGGRIKVGLEIGKIGFYSPFGHHFGVQPLLN